MSVCLQWLKDPEQIFMVFDYIYNHVPVFIKIEQQ